MWISQRYSCANASSSGSDASRAPRRDFESDSTRSSSDESSAPALTHQMAVAPQSARSHARTSRSDADASPSFTSSSMSAGSLAALNAPLSSRGSSAPLSCRPDPGRPQPPVRPAALRSPRGRRRARHRHGRPRHGRRPAPRALWPGPPGWAPARSPAHAAPPLAARRTCAERPSRRSGAHRTPPRRSHAADRARRSTPGRRRR